MVANLQTLKKHRHDSPLGSSENTFEVIKLRNSLCLENIFSHKMTTSKSSTKTHIGLGSKTQFYKFSCQPKRRGAILFSLRRRHFYSAKERVDYITFKGLPAPAGYTFNEAYHTEPQSSLTHCQSAYEIFKKNALIKKLGNNRQDQTSTQLWKILDKLKFCAL